MIFPFSFERSKTVFCSPRAKSRQTNRGRFISGTDTGCCSKFTSWTHFNPKGENGSEGKLERGIHLQCKTRANPTQVIEILQQLNKCAGKESLWIFLYELQFKLEEFWMQSQLIGIPLLHIFSFIWTCCTTQSLWLICFCISLCVRSIRRFWLKQTVNQQGTFVHRSIFQSGKKWICFVFRVSHVESSV